jgi:multiple sugar transport system substrate-binding protein
VAINEKVVEVFEADNPHIQVETFHRPWNDYFKELRPKLAAGEPVPDVLFWTQTPIDIPHGYFLDLTPLMAAENYSLADFFPGLLQHFQVGGAIYGLPRDSDTKVIFYNKRLFNRANQPFPKAGWSWDDLRATALALKEAGVVEYSFAYEVNTWWLIWMWQNEVEVFDDAFFPSKTSLGEPAAAEAVQFFADLTNVDKVTPPYEVLRGSQDIATLFREEKLAMAFGNHALIPAFADIDAFEWDVVELPQRKRPANLAAGAGYVISANTPQPKAAWTFLKFLAGPKGQAIFTEAGVAVPARRSVAESDIFMNQKPRHNAQAFLNGVEIGQPDPAFLGINEILAIMDDEALPPVWRGEQDAASAIQAVLPEIEQIIEANQQPPKR